MQPQARDNMRLSILALASLCVLTVTAFTWPFPHIGAKKSSRYHQHQELFVSTTNTQTPIILDEYDNDGLKERLRNAYERWCSLHGKRFDESRLEIFSSRYLQAEQHAQKTGVTIQLNEFADLTDIEYQQLFTMKTMGYDNVGNTQGTTSTTPAPIQTSVTSTHTETVSNGSSSTRPQQQSYLDNLASNYNPFRPKTPRSPERKQPIPPPPPTNNFGAPKISFQEPAEVRTPPFQSYDSPLYFAEEDDQWMADMESRLKEQVEAKLKLEFETKEEIRRNMEETETRRRSAEEAGRLRALEDQLSSVESAKREMETKLGEAERLIASLESRTTSSSDIVTALEDEKAELDGLLRRSQEEAEIVRTQLQARIEDVKKKAEEHAQLYKEELARVTEEKRLAEDELLRKADEEGKRLEKEIELLEARKRADQEEQLRKDLEARIELYESSKKFAQTRLEESEKWISSLGGQAKSSADIVANLEREKANIERQLRDSQSEVEATRVHLQQEIDKLRRKAVEDARLHFEEISQLKSKLSVADDEKRSLAAAEARLIEEKRLAEERLAQFEEGKQDGVIGDTADSELRLKLEQMEAAKKDVERRLADAQLWISSMDVQSKSSAEIVYSLQREKNQLESALNESRREVESVRNHLQEEITALKLRVTEAESKLEQEKAERLAVEEKLKIEYEIHNAEKERLVAEARIAARQANEADRFQTAEEKAEAEEEARMKDFLMRQEEARLRDLEGRLESIEESKSKVEAELRDARQTISSLEAQASSYNDKIAALEQEKSEAKRLLSESQNEANSIMGLESRLQLIESSESNMKEQLADAQKLISTLEAEAAASTKSVSTLASEKSNIERLLMESKNEVQTIRGQLQSEIDSLRNAASLKAFEEERLKSEFEAKLRQAEETARIEESKKRLAEETLSVAVKNLAEEKAALEEKLAEEAIKAEKKLAEQARISEEKLAEQARITEAKYEAEQARIAEEKRKSAEAEAAKLNAEHARMEANKRMAEARDNFMRKQVPAQYNKAASTFVIPSKSGISRENRAKAAQSFGTSAEFELSRTRPEKESKSPSYVYFAKVLADEHGVDLRTVRGSGPGGRIEVSDIQAVIGTAPAPSRSSQAVSNLSTGRASRNPSGTKSIFEGLFNQFTDLQKSPAKPAPETSDDGLSEPDFSIPEVIESKQSIPSEESETSVPTTLDGVPVSDASPIPPSSPDEQNERSPGLVPFTITPMMAAKLHGRTVGPVGRTGNTGSRTIPVGASRVAGRDLGGTTGAVGRPTSSNSYESPGSTIGNMGGTNMNLGGTTSTVRNEGNARDLSETTEVVRRAGGHSGGASGLVGKIGGSAGALGGAPISMEVSKDAAQTFMERSRASGEYGRLETLDDLGASMDVPEAPAIPDEEAAKSPGMIPFSLTPHLAEKSKGKVIGAKPVVKKATKDLGGTTSTLRRAAMEDSDSESSSELYGSGTDSQETVMQSAGRVVAVKKIGPNRASHIRLEESRKKILGVKTTEESSVLGTETEESVMAEARKNIFGEDSQSKFGASPEEAFSAAGVSSGYIPFSVTPHLARGSGTSGFGGFKRVAPKNIASTTSIGNSSPKQTNTEDSSRKTSQGPLARESKSRVNAEIRQSNHTSQTGAEPASAMKGGADGSSIKVSDEEPIKGSLTPTNQTVETTTIKAEKPVEIPVSQAKTTKSSVNNSSSSTIDATIKSDTEKSDIDSSNSMTDAVSKPKTEKSSDVDSPKSMPNAISKSMTGKSSDVDPSKSATDAISKSETVKSSDIDSSKSATDAVSKSDATERKGGGIKATSPKSPAKGSPKRTSYRDGAKGLTMNRKTPSNTALSNASTSEVDTMTSEVDIMTSEIGTITPSPRLGGPLPHYIRITKGQFQTGERLLEQATKEESSARADFPRGLEIDFSSAKEAFDESCESGKTPIDSEDSVVEALKLVEDDSVLEALKMVEEATKLIQEVEETQKAVRDVKGILNATLKRRDKTSSNEDVVANVFKAVQDVKQTHDAAFSMIKGIFTKPAGGSVDRATKSKSGGTGSSSNDAVQEALDAVEEANKLIRDVEKTQKAGKDIKAKMDKKGKQKKGFGNWF